MLYLGIETHFWLDSQTVQTTHPSYCPPSTAPFTITITISCSRPLHLVHLGLPVLHSGRPQTILCTLSFSLGLPSNSSLTLSPSRGEVSCLPLPFDGPGQVCLTYTLSPPSHSIIFTPLTKSIRLQLYNVLHIPQLHVNIAEKVTLWTTVGRNMAILVNIPTILTEDIMVPQDHPNLMVLLDNTVWPVGSGLNWVTNRSS